MKEEITAAYLRGLLRQAGLTQQAAADLVGVTIRTMQRYLTEKEASHIRKSALAMLQQAAANGSAKPTLMPGSEAGATQ